MDIYQLELFLAVINAPTMTHAAQRVYLSPGAVSLQLHKLAEELHTELFVRNGKRLIPTPAALRLAEHAQSIINLRDHVRQDFENDVTKDTRIFHFATGVTTLIYQLGEPLREIRKQYPNADIRVTVSTTEQTMSGLQNRQFDLGLVSLPASEGNLTITPLFEEELLILRPSAKNVHGGQIGWMRPSELAGVPFLLYPRGTVLRVLIDRLFQEIGVIPRVMMEAEDTEAIKRLVESGFGYSILPEQAVRQRTHFFQRYRISGHRLCRTLALAMARTEYPRKLTLSIAKSLEKMLAPAGANHKPL